MRRDLLNYLACPECAASLDVQAFRVNAPNGMEEIQDGVLVCSGCQRIYLIDQYVPRFLPDYAKQHPDFQRRYAIELKQISECTGTSEAPANRFHDLQSLTIRNFGFEWKVWNNFGWGDEVPLDTTRAIFDYKVLAKKHELANKLVLDAGCGNGRYTTIAAEYGGTVIGIDLSDAVDVAREHFAANPKVHIVQGDLFRPPFKREIFDFVFSNGVLMHTGDAKGAFLSLCRFLRPDGAITIHVYHTGNVIYEIVDAALRAITTRIPLSWAMLWSRAMAYIARLIPKQLLNNIVNGFIRLERHPHYVFDWYTAPIATHHTYPEVYGWVKEAGLHLVQDHNATNRPMLRKFFPFLFLTVKAQKQPVSHEPLHTRS